MSKVSLYAKINGLEPKLSQALVRYSSQQLSAVVTEFNQVSKIVFPGYKVRIIDGNHIGGTEHRLKVLRSETAEALPGQAIAVLDQQREMVVDVFPEEDAHAQERSLLPLVLLTFYLQSKLCSKMFVVQEKLSRACPIILWLKKSSQLLEEWRLP